MMRTTRATLQAGLMAIAVGVVIGCGRSPAPQTPAVPLADRTPAVPVRVRGTMSSVEESLAVHGYFFYEEIPGSHFHQKKPHLTDRHRISISPRHQPLNESRLRMKFNLDNDGATIRSIELKGNPLEGSFLFEVDNVSRQLDDELSEKEFDTSSRLRELIRYAASNVYVNFKPDRVGDWYVERKDIADVSRISSSAAYPGHDASIKGVRSNTVRHSGCWRHNFPQSHGTLFAPGEASTIVRRWRLRTHGRRGPGGCQWR